MSNGPHLAVALRLIFTVSAAKHDASPDQHKQLNERVPPLIDKLRQNGRTAPLYLALADIMGKDWKPSGHYETWLINFRRDNKLRTNRSTKGDHDRARFS
jgi:hypothetical protein